MTTAAEGVSWPYRVLFTPDLSTVVLPDLRNHEVRFLERATRRELSRLSLAGAGPQGVTMTPDGRYLLESLSAQAQCRGHRHADAHGGRPTSPPGRRRTGSRIRRM